LASLVRFISNRSTLTPMNPVAEFQALVAAFTDEMAELGKREALRQVSEAFGVHTPTRAAPRPSTNGKRSAVELGEIKKRLLEHLAAHPGLRMEEIKAALDAPTKELVLPLRQLVAEGSLRTEGQRRGMRYYAGGTTKRARRGAKQPKAKA
jgi:hypothetical protein